MSLIQFDIGLPVAALICLVMTALACILFPKRVNDMLDVVLEQIAESGEKAA